MSTETIEQVFEVQSPVHLKVSNIRGHIDIQPGEDNVIKVLVEKHNNSGSGGKTQIDIHQESDGTVVAETKHENSIINWFGMIKPCRVDFTIQVPKVCSVIVNCVSSTATIEGLEGLIKVHGVSGNIQLRDLKGEFIFSSVSGKIIADNLDGPLDMNNVSGKVKISQSHIPAMTGKTVSGSAIIETPIAEGPYELNSVSGNMSVITPEDTACTVFMKSVSGKAKINLPVTNRQGARNKQVIEVAGGGPEIRMKSVSGVLKLGSPSYAKSTSEPIEENPGSKISIDDELIVEDQLVDPMQSPKSQLQILQEIENGEISVDEALKQLNP
jgi:DUF4097 and DUF4098 domain-containing protein YvlB